MKISVYVPCHDNEATLGAVLEGLRRQTREADEWIFINDHCTDRSPALAREWGFEVVELSGVRGLGAGRNAAWRKCSGDILMGVDADVLLEPGYLAGLERLFMAHPSVGVIGGRLRERFTETPADLWRSVHMPQHLGDAMQHDPRMVFGSTMACRVAALAEVGGWNESYITNYEDVDLCTRIKEAGGHLLYSPDCEAWHLRRDTLDSVLFGHWRWNYFGYERYFSSVEQWLVTRLPLIWNTYRAFREMDRSHPALPPITLLHPWAWLVRDLQALRQTCGEIGEIRAVVEIARKVLLDEGLDPGSVEKIGQWLGQLAAEPGGGLVLRPQLDALVAGSIYWLARETIGGTPSGDQP